MRHHSRFTCLQSFVMTTSLALSILSATAHAQILNTADLERETAKLEAAAQHADPPQMSAAQAGEIWTHLGTLYQDAGKYTQSQAAYEHAIKLLTVPGSHLDLATPLDRLGTLYLQTGNINKAEQAERQALQLRQTAAVPSQLAQSWYHLANLSLRKHQLPQAEQFATTAVASFANDPQATPEDKLGSLFLLASTLMQEQRATEAIARYQQALTLSRTLEGEESYPTAFAQFLLANAQWKSGDADSAREPFAEAYRILTQEISWHPSYRPIMQTYARFLHSEHQRAEEQAVLADIKKHAGDRSTVELSDSAINPSF